MSDAEPLSTKAATEARKTYRYLRIGMVGMVVFLATSLVIEAAKADCLQTSISAYYYTPVRSVFVGGMIAIGLCLIVIKGSTPWGGRLPQHRRHVRARGRTRADVIRGQVLVGGADTRSQSTAKVNWQDGWWRTSTTT